MCSIYQRWPAPSMVWGLSASKTDMERSISNNTPHGRYKWLYYEKFVA